MKIGLLDFGEIEPRSNAIETIHHTIENAVLAESNGFSRYWLTEHYQNGLAWRNPELILSLIAASTDTIKVGAAGVLLMINNPFRVAQDFKLLCNLFANRVDLGFAKGSIDEKTYEAIRGHEAIPDLSEGIAKTIGFLNNKVQHLLLTPASGLKPDLWMLGTSSSSIPFAVQKKMNFSLSLFHSLHTPLPSPDIIAMFKEKFFNENGYTPQVNIAVSVFCSGKEKRTSEERKTRKNVLLNICGSAENCRDRIRELVKAYGTKEAIVLNLGRDQAEKQELIEALRVNQILH
jgi:luciferase family oxidoreductase group 1